MHQYKSARMLPVKGRLLHLLKWIEPDAKTNGSKDILTGSLHFDPEIYKDQAKNVKGLGISEVNN